MTEKCENYVQIQNLKPVARWCKFMKFFLVVLFLIACLLAIAFWVDISVECRVQDMRNEIATELNAAIAIREEAAAEKVRIANANVILYDKKIAKLQQQLLEEVSERNNIVLLLNDKIDELDSNLFSTLNADIDEYNEFVAGYNKNFDILFGKIKILDDVANEFEGISRVLTIAFNSLSSHSSELRAIRDELKEKKK